MAKPTTKTEIVPVDNRVGDNVPAFMQAGNCQVRAGSDNFDSTDVALPRIKLLQGTSPEIEAFTGAKIGEFWHSGMDMSLGSKFKFVIADRRKKYLLSAPLEDGQGVLARSDDALTWDRLGKWTVKIKGVKQPVTWEIDDLNVAKSGLADWGTFNPDDEVSPPAATLFYDYLVFLPDHPDLGPAIVSLARSAIRQAKKGLNDKISIHKTNGRPMQGLVFSAESYDDQADGQSFKNWRFASAGFVQDKGLFDFVMEHSGALATVKVANEADIGQPSPVSTDDGKGDF